MVAGMAVGVRSTLTGAKELERALSQLPKSTSKSVLRRALKNAAKPTVVLAESLAPRDTGKFAESFEIRAQLKKSQKFGRGKIGDVEMFVGSTDPKAHLIEFGTVKMAPRPTLRPAWDSTKQKVLDAIEREIWESLAKAARTLAKKAQAGTLGKSARKALGR